MNVWLDVVVGFRSGTPRDAYSMFVAYVSVLSFITIVRAKGPSMGKAGQSSAVAALPIRVAATTAAL